MFISLGTLNYKCLLFIFVPIFFYARGILEDNIDIKHQNLFTIPFLRAFARSLAIFLWLYLHKNVSKMKSKNTEEKENENSFDEEVIKSRIISEYEINRHKDDIKKGLLAKNFGTNSLNILIIEVIIEFICCFLFSTLFKFKIAEGVTGGIVIISIFVRLVVLAIISYFYIKSNKIYKHQYFSIIMITILVLVIAITSGFKEKTKNYFVKLIFEIMPDVLYSLSYSLGLLYLIKSDGNLYKILTINGFFGMVMLIILQIIFAFILCEKNDTFVENFNYCENGSFNTFIYNLRSFENFGGFFSLGFIVVNLIENITIYLLSYNFSINHYGALCSIPIFVDYIIEFKVSNDDDKIYAKIIYIVGGIIICIMTLVYNEIIILNFCGLEKGTKKEIEKRSLMDSSRNRSTKFTISNELYDLGE